MHTTVASQATPPPAPDAAPYPPDPTLLPSSFTTRSSTPSVACSPPAPAHPRLGPATMPPSPTHATGLDPVVASPLPGNADEAHLAARVAAADAYAMDYLRPAQDCRAAPMLSSMRRPGRLHDREAHGARAQLMRIQAERPQARVGHPPAHAAGAMLRAAGRARQWSSAVRVLTRTALRRQVTAGAAEAGLHASSVRGVCTPILPTNGGSDWAGATIGCHGRKPTLNRRSARRVPISARSRLPPDTQWAEAGAVVEMVGSGNVRVHSPP